MDELSNLLTEALRHHESGELGTAEPLYRQVLRVDPGHVDALYHLGTLELQQAQRTVGIAQTRRTDGAEPESASDGPPADWSTRLAAGIELLEQAARLRPDMAEIHNNLGIAYRALGNWNAAAAAFEQAVTADPASAGAYFNMADLAETLGQHDAAVACYRQAISLEPRTALHYVRLGNLLYAHGNWAGSAQCFTSALALGRPVAAGTTGDSKHSPDVEQTLELQSKLGMALVHQEQLDAAVRVFLRMLEIRPDFAEIHSNLAYVYERQGKLAESLAAAQLAVRLKPDYAEGFNNLGVACRSLHRVEEARAAFETALRLKPDFELARFNLGAICLLAGDYAAGWPGYESRMLTLAVPTRSLTGPRWDGRPLPGGKLLLHAEQGMGDTLQFVRFVQQAKEVSQARILLEAPAELLSLLRGVDGIDELICAGKTLPEYDAQLPIPSLPGMLQVTLEQLTAQAPYIRVADPVCEGWRARLTALVAPKPADGRDAGAGPGAQSLRVGIVWQGNPAQPRDKFRSCPLAEFDRLAGIGDIAWFSLQKDIFPLPASSLAPVPLGPELRDFNDTAAVLTELDLLISVDTSVAHLAGALGRPVWTLLCHTPDWRWHLDRTDSPWYPTMRLFRQAAWGDWSSVFEQVADALRQQVDS